MADPHTPTPDPSASSARSFWALLVTQFQGAFSDNAFKTLVSFLVVQGQLQQHGKGLVLLVGALFAIPFLVFSMAGGFLADRYSKRTVTIGTKWMELGVMVLALVGLSAGNVAVQLTAVFLMSVQSALFSPSKYGLLPELLPESRLSWGNGVLNLATFGAIISGIVTGGLLAEGFGPSQYLSGLTLVGLALVGLATASLIGRVPAADPARRFEANFIGEIVGQLKQIRRDRLLNLAVLGNGYFYFLASFLQFNILFYGLEVLGVGETSNSILMAAVAVGIGVGSLLAGLLSGGKIEYGLVPLGAIGMALLALLLAAPGLSYASVALLLAGLGCFGGFFSVPVLALVQHLPEEREKGRVLAATNIVSFLGVALASAAYYACVLAGLDPARIFLVSALMTGAALLRVISLQPDSVLRMALWLLTQALYRVRVRGRSNLPDKGAAIFVSNRLTLIDALLLVSATDRPVYFLADRDSRRSATLKVICRLMGAIDTSSAEPEIRARLQDARRLLQGGEVICLFSEESRSSGPTLREGLDLLDEGGHVPVVGMQLEGPGFDTPSGAAGLLKQLLSHPFSKVVLRVGRSGERPRRGLDGPLGLIGSCGAEPAAGAE